MYSNNYNDDDYDDKDDGDDDNNNKKNRSQVGVRDLPPSPFPTSLTLITRNSGLCYDPVMAQWLYYAADDIFPDSLKYRLSDVGLTVNCVIRESASGLVFSF